MKTGLIVIVPVVFIFSYSGCRSTDYKKQLAILQKEKEELQMKLSEAERELVVKQAVIERLKRQEELKKQEELKSGRPSLPLTHELKMPKSTDIEAITKLLKKQNFYGVKPQKSVIVVIIARDIFQSGSDKLTKKGENEIKKLANVLKHHKPRKIEIKGHTDNTALRQATAAKFIDNFGLSSARAIAAKKLLLQYFNFDPVKITIEGMGDTKVLTSNKTAAGRNINRRLEFYLHY
ncbi:MAG: flagellar motor protein MotB [Planctomycetota bacterium]